MAAGKPSRSRWRAPRMTIDGEALSLALCAPDEHEFTLTIDNSYAPFPVGQQLILEGVEEEEGEIVSHEGAWRADESGNAPGIFMPDDPEVGMRFQREAAPGVAEDKAEILAVDETVTVPHGTFEDPVRLVEWNPLEGQTADDGDEKTFAGNVGLIVDDPIELVAASE